MGWRRSPTVLVRRRRPNVAGLTSRQAEVLTLVCAGLPNAEIASRLYISKKTVEHHVAAILNKLEVGTRSEAIVAARRLEGGDPSAARRSRTRSIWG